MTTSWAIRLAVPPDRNVVSRAAVTSSRSATSAIGEPAKFVITIVVAPRLRASCTASMVSTVVPVCEIPIADIAGTEQRRRGQGDVALGPAEDHPADPVQLLLQILTDQTTGPDPVDVDPLRLAERVDRLRQDVDVQQRRGLLHRPRLGMGDLGDDVGHRVLRADVGTDRPVAGLVVLLPLGGPGQRDPQLRIAAEADGPAEPQALWSPRSGTSRATAVIELSEIPAGSASTASATRSSAGRRLGSAPRTLTNTDTDGLCTTDISAPRSIIIDNRPPFRVPSPLVTVTPVMSLVCPTEMNRSTVGS